MTIKLGELNKWMLADEGRTVPGFL